MHQYYIIYKPFQVLSQFTSQEGKRTLKDFFPVPPDVYPVGRLDFDGRAVGLLADFRIHVVVSIGSNPRWNGAAGGRGQPDSSTSRNGTFCVVYYAREQS